MEYDEIKVRQENLWVDQQPDKHNALTPGREACVPKMLLLIVMANAKKID